jgi:TonB family protein
MASSRWLLAAYVITFLPTTQQATTLPVVVLSRIQVSYPAIAESARVTGKVEVRVGVRPDGSVAETTVLDGLPLLNDAVVNAASGATFECRLCTALSTPHRIRFVFSFEDLNTARTAWRQTEDASSEVTVFGHLPVLYPPGKPSRSHAARCLWLWRCSKYVMPIL